MKRVFNLTITKNHPIIKNHIVHGENILPGLAYIDMIFQIAKSLSLDYKDYSLKGLSIFNPLIVKDDYPVKVVMTFSKIKEYWQISVEGMGQASNSKNILYITAQLHKNTMKIKDNINISDIKKAVNTIIDVENVYKDSRERGLVHKGIIKSKGKIYLTDFGCLSELDLDMDYQNESEEYIFHPTLIDGTGMASGILHGRDENLDDLYLPLYYEEFSCIEKLNSGCYTMVRKSSINNVNEIRKMDIEIYNKEGNFVGQLKGITSKKIRFKGLINNNLGEEKIYKHAHDNVKSNEKQELDVIRKHDDENIRNTLIKTFAKYINTSETHINNNVGFYELGLSSSQLLQIVNELAGIFDITLSPTLLFECSNINELVDYFIENLDIKQSDENYIDNVNHVEALNIEVEAEGINTLEHDNISKSDIAIIGIAAQFPKAENVDDYWENLINGRDCITEIPEDRWEKDKFKNLKSPSGKNISKYGGFIKDYDCFDPKFFRISPRETETIDPQERLFLKSCWEAIEDAGYTSETLVKSVGKNHRRKVGVYVGVMHKDYSLIGLENIYNNNILPLSLNYAPIANRVSYFLNFHGPSMAIDTVCSSSLVSVHMAVENLRSGECNVALAGGVNLSLHWGKYLTYGLADMHSSKGQCNSFGKGADGYVSSDGIGVVLLKPLAQAIKDKDHIYSVIRGSAVNHGGAASGITVPNIVAQADVITSCIEKAKVDPRTISYIEAHGTGTSLGDPIELNGLVKAYNQYTKDKQFCAIGSVKSNIGHAESAAGISALIKVALQLSNKTLVPSIHAEEINQLLNFNESPFYLQKSTEVWKKENGEKYGYPLRAGISSFGATGTNAHIILEEYLGEGNNTKKQQGMQGVIIPISAKNKEGLKNYVSKMLEYIKKRNVCNDDKKFINNKEIDLNDMAFTLQVGREAMEYRIVFIVRDVNELILKMEYYLENNEVSDNCYEAKINNTGATRCNIKSIA